MTLKHVANAMQRAEGFVLERALVYIGLHKLIIINLVILMTILIFGMICIVCNTIGVCRQLVLLFSLHKFHYSLPALIREPSFL